MIDYSNEIFNTLATKLRAKYSNITVIGEYVSVPSSFPCVTIDEISNIASNLTSATDNDFADIGYRVQIFSNKSVGKRAEARAIYNTVDNAMHELNLFGKAFSTTPEIYNSNVYQISDVYQATINKSGVIYRR